MVPPAQHWCIHLDVTYACTRNCANCHRFIPHHTEKHEMSVEQVQQGIAALQGYCERSPGNPKHWRKGVKCVSLFGGEPLLHPQLGELLEAMHALPQRHRALYTGLNWTKHRLAKQLEETFLPEGWLQCNRHEHVCMHQPSLIAVGELIPDPELRARLIRNCPVQRYWSSAITHKGYFFCEIAAGLDALFEGPGGKPVEPGCWEQPLEHYQDQIDRWCNLCGMCVPFAGRDSNEGIDDITPGNLALLRALDSPRVQAGKYRIVDPKTYDFHREAQAGWDPLRYNRFIEDKPWEEVDYMLEAKA